MFMQFLAAFFLMTDLKAIHAPSQRCQGAESFVKAMSSCLSFGTVERRLTPVSQCRDTDI